VRLYIECRSIGQIDADRSGVSRYTYRPFSRSEGSSRHDLPLGVVSPAAMRSARVCISRRPSGSRVESQAEIHIEGFTVLGYDQGGTEGSQIL
jgi:hypothetical protein